MRGPASVASDGDRDRMPDAADLRESELDRLKDELRALQADVARLRQERQADRAALHECERLLIVKTGELAAIHASRSWKAARALGSAAALRRRFASPRSTAPAAPSAAPAPPSDAAPARRFGEMTATQPDVSLVLMPGGAASLTEVLDLLDRTEAGRRYEVLTTVPSGHPAVRTFGAPDGANATAICNAGAAAAQAPRIVFWHPATKPHPGWLAALDQCLTDFPDAGMAGGVLLNADGRLACAHLSLAGDGALQPQGQAESQFHPAFASVEAVDALPLGALMLPRAAWQQSGGLDAEIAALGYAFAELGLRLREAGRTVLRQPFARLTGEAAPRYGEWDDAYGRWRQRQLHLRRGRGLQAVGVPPAAQPRVLFFDHFVPTPDRDSGSGDIYWFLRIFRDLGYEVTLLPADDGARADHYVDDLRRCGIRVVANGWVPPGTYFLSIDRTPFDLIIAYRGTLVAPAMLDVLKSHSPNAKLVFNTVDLHFLRMEREALLARSAELLDAAFAMQRTELAAIHRVDCTILLSQAEQRLVADLLPRARTAVIPIVREIQGRRQGFANRRGVLFVGGFNHRPNVDAIVTFVREVWPLVRARLDVRLAIIGANAPPEVQALGSADGVELLGYVADLDTALAVCRLTVAPLRYGAGIKGKIVSSIAAGVPCVASAVAVEGMGIGDEVREAESPQAFADAVIEVHETPEVWTHLSDAGLRFAHATFSVASARQRIAALLASLDLPHGAAEAG